MAQKASGKKRAPENACIFGESPSEKGLFLKRSEKTASQAPAATRLCRPRNTTNKVALSGANAPAPPRGSLLNEKAAKPHNIEPRPTEGEVSTQSTEKS